MRFNPHHACEDPMLVLVQGRHGYISPSWYAPGATRAPTWNFSVAHCYGVPEVLIRVPITRSECKRKLSQDKDPVSRRQVIAALRAPGPYSHPQLADAMERELTR